ncbi:MAG: type I 3-dehydroquinate dehydratase [Dorea sp.]|nr:type I 3-dehydroquinate dehydratase [Dorea sp.]
MLCGEAFGSAVTFGSTGKASAPGRVEAGELRCVFTLLYAIV